MTPVIRIPNYEVALSSIEDVRGVVPIVALSFSWSDTKLAPPSVWTDDTSRLDVTKEGLEVTLDDKSLLFPLVENVSERGMNAEGFAGGLDRAQVLSLLKAHEALYVAAFDDDGEMIAHIGFVLNGP